jgi:hypothetical protein
MSRDMVRMGGIVAVTLIVAITALTIFHPGDNTAIISSMVAAALALFSALSSRTNAGRIQDNADRIEHNAAQTSEKLHAMHVDINDRVDQLVAAEKSASRAEGATEERGKHDRPGESS